MQEKKSPAGLFFSHSFLIGGDVLIDVVGGVAGVDARHPLHDVIGALLQLRRCLRTGQVVIVAQGLAHRQVHQRRFSEQALELVAGAECEYQRKQGAVVPHRILEYRLFQWADVGVVEPHGALGVEVHPPVACQHLFHGVLKLFHTRDASGGDGDAARHTDEGAVGTLQVDLPRGEVTQTGAQSLHHAEEVPHKHVIGHGDESVVQQVFVLFEDLLAVDAQTVGDAQQGEQQEVEHHPHKAALQCKPRSLLQVGVVFVQVHVPQMGDVDHVLVALGGIFVAEVVAIVHSRSFQLLFVDAALPAAPAHTLVFVVAADLDLVALDHDLAVLQAGVDDGLFAAAADRLDLGDAVCDLEQPLGAVE